MQLPRTSLSRLLALTLTGTIGLTMLPSAHPLRAADHGDSPAVDQDRGADLGDVYFFLDPNDNTRAILIMTVHGFIVPGEALNFAAFDPKLRYYFDIENTGDASSDKFVKITFGLTTAPNAPQTATIDFDGKTFTGLTTPPTAAPVANVQTVTTDDATGIKFFAGEVDDPFFFDVVAFSRFVASVRAGAPDATVFNRGRDTFAGYNTLGIALSVPVDLLKGSSGNVVGLEARTKRQTQKPDKNGGFRKFGRALTIDRAANPAVNTVLIPFARKSEYNAAKTTDDAAGQFANDIVATLHLFGTDDAHIAALAGVAVTKGDFLHLDLTIANNGPNGGTNPAAAFPNGRRPADDVIDTLLTIIANGNTLGDNVNASEVPVPDTFPFLALPHQPLANTTAVDDGTRN